MQLIPFGAPTFRFSGELNSDALAYFDDMGVCQNLALLPITNNPKGLGRDIANQGDARACDMTTAPTFSRFKRIGL